MQELARPIPTESWQVIVVLICILLLTYLRVGFPRASLLLLSTPFRKVQSRDLDAAEQQLISHFTLPATLVSWLAMGMLTFILGRDGWLSGEPIQMEFNHFVSATALFATFSILKHLVSQFWNSWIFESPDFRPMLERRYNTWYVNGMLLFFLLALPWLNSSASDIWLFGAMGILALLYALSVFRTIVFLSLCKHVSIYYKILYLCALEIAPIGLIYYWLSISY